MRQNHQKKQNTEEVAEKPVSQTKTEKTKKSASELRKANAEKTKQDVLEIITSKLGLKTQERQKDLFSAQATKIRLSLLPEIFASIADTRKTDRMVGKRRIKSSNKDALDLYLLISGNNRKFVNYLLKKRNVDGTRMFEVKEIISMVRAAESKIEQDKKANPAYRANDARKYYNHLYESKIQQYGKVTKSRVA